MAWSTLAEPGDHAAQRLVADVGPVRALRRVLAGSGDARWRVRFSELNPRRDLRTLRRFDGRLVIPGDEEWPLNLTALGTDAPFCLYVRGPTNLSEATARSAAIVGARACTPYGEHVAAELGDGCALRGITVVSGAAYGIDGAAHRGALAGGGPTIAVLAVRCRPRLPERTRATHRAHRIGRGTGERGASRAIADTLAVRRTQPAHRSPVASDGRGRGLTPIRCRGTAMRASAWAFRWRRFPALSRRRRPTVAIA